MKPFLGIDLTENKHNTAINGKEFMVTHTTAAVAASVEENSAQIEEKMAASKLPLPLRAAQWICGIGGAIIIAGIVRATTGTDSVTWAQAYANASWLFWVGGAAVLIWLVLWLCASHKEKRVLGSDESAQIMENMVAIEQAARADLGVPESAREVDVLSFFYKEKNGEIKVQEKGFQLFSHFNPIFYAYTEGENLCLTNLEIKCAFPLSSLRAIRTVKKAVRTESWNKDEGFDEGTYKPYKLSADQYGCIHSKPHYVLELERDGERWGVYFPKYELEIFEQLTGLKAEE